MQDHASIRLRPEFRGKVADPGSAFELVYWDMKKNEIKGVESLANRSRQACYGQQKFWFIDQTAVAVLPRMRLEFKGRVVLEGTLLHLTKHSVAPAREGNTQ